MEPSEVDSPDDIRDGWDSWSYNERVEALENLVNATLDQYGYDSDVDVETGARGGFSGQYDPNDGTITLDPAVIEDPDPEWAIHVTNHETVHAMNYEDGIDDGSYQDGDPGNLDITEEEFNAYLEHGKVGDIARELDQGVDRGGGGGGGGGGGDGGESAAGGDDSPLPSDLEMEIDWSQGVWGDTINEGNPSPEVEVTYSPPEGW